MDWGLNLIAFGLMATVTSAIAAGGKALLEPSSSFEEVVGSDFDGRMLLGVAWFIDIYYALLRYLEIVTVLSVHCAGCFFFLLAARYPDPSTTWIGASMPDFHSKSLRTQYVMDALSTVGYGDLHTKNTREIQFKLPLDLLRETNY